MYSLLCRSFTSQGLGLHQVGIRLQMGMVDHLQFLPALAEAQDIHVHLIPLQHHLETLENAEFPEVKPRLRPLLHVVCLIWATCKCYRSPGRLTVLLQEICNLLIQQVGCPGMPSNCSLGGGWHLVTGERQVSFSLGGEIIMFQRVLTLELQYFTLRSQ